MLLVDKTKYCTSQTQSVSLKSKQLNQLAIYVALTTNVFMLSVSQPCSYNTYTYVRRVSVLICHIEIYPKLPIIINKRHTLKYNLYAFSFTVRFLMEFAPCVTRGIMP